MVDERKRSKKERPDVLSGRDFIRDDRTVLCSNCQGKCEWFKKFVEKCECRQEWVGVGYGADQGRVIAHVGLLWAGLV